MNHHPNTLQIASNIYNSDLQFPASDLGFFSHPYANLYSGTHQNQLKAEAKVLLT